MLRANFNKLFGNIKTQMMIVYVYSVCNFVFLVFLIANCGDYDTTLIIIEKYKFKNCFILKVT